MSAMRAILGIETSCDETAAAIVTADRRVLADVVLSQTRLHEVHGGVVPEIAARAHLQHVDALIAEALRRAGIAFADLAAVAATTGPGLIGGLIVGAMSGKAIAIARGLPFIAVNHLEGHALSARLDPGVEFPFLLLLVSGGHCQLILVEGVGRYTALGTTVDDAAGEAFDKTAKLLGLGYPGGPAIERAAREGDTTRFKLPRPMLGRASCDFSFAGLKTAVRQIVENAIARGETGIAADLAASFQQAVVDVLVDRVAQAMRRFRDRHPQGGAFVVAGGVAANSVIRTRLAALAAQNDFTFAAPPQRLCTDNAAMIAWAALERVALGEPRDLEIAPRPRWPLAELQPAR
jgi:N6-L-threonylcarbamoyladenine synthase